ERFDAREQLAEIEWLRQVVVGAELQAEYSVDDLAAGGEHENRRLHAEVAHVAADVESITARQRDVEDDQIERLARDAIDCSLAVADCIDDVAFTGEAIAQRDDEAFFVLDDQDAALQRRRTRHPTPRESAA